MKENENHAYMRDFEKNGVRSFDINRSKLMQYIIPTIAFPNPVLGNYGNDICCLRFIDKRAYAVVLEWDKGKKMYHFRSAHVWNSEELSRNRKKYDAAIARGVVVKEKTPPKRLSKSFGGVCSKVGTILQEAGCPTFSDLRTTCTGDWIGNQIRGALVKSSLSSRWPSEEIISEVKAFIKSSGAKISPPKLYFMFRKQHAY